MSSGFISVTVANGWRSFNSPSSSESASAFLLITKTNNSHKNHLNFNSTYSLCLLSFFSFFLSFLCFFFFFSSPDDSSSFSFSSFFFFLSFLTAQDSRWENYHKITTSVAYLSLVSPVLRISQSWHPAKDDCSHRLATIRSDERHQLLRQHVQRQHVHWKIYKMSVKRKWSIVELLTCRDEGPVV